MYSRTYYANIFRLFLLLLHSVSHITALLRFCRPSFSTDSDGYYQWSVFRRWSPSLEYTLSRAVLLSKHRLFSCGEANSRSNRDTNNLGELLVLCLTEIFLKRKFFSQTFSKRNPITKKPYSTFP